MQLSFSSKEHFFHGLAQMLRSGLPMTEALGHLAAGRDRSAKCAAKIAMRIREGLAEAFRAGGFSDVDVEILSAGELSGRLEEACERLAEYYQSLAAARRKVMAASLYPVFMIHLAALLLSIPRGILAGDMSGFVRSVVEILGPVYGVGAGLILLFGLLRGLSCNNETGDRLIRRIPGIGGLFRNAALSRFCLVLSLGIRSASGVLASLERAGRASRSATIRLAAGRSVAEIRGGAGFAESLCQGAVFPGDLERAMRVAEASGRLDEEMTRWAGIFRERLFAAIDAVQVWFPRILYLAVLIGVALQIFSLVNEVSGQVNEALKIE